MRDVIYVSPDGGGVKGTREAPVALEFLHKRISFVTEKDGFHDGIEVIFRGGTYYMHMPFKFDVQNGIPITFKAEEGERVTLVGGLPLEMTEGEYNGMRTWFCKLPDVAAGKRKDCCNVLLAGGKRRDKTRIPETGSFRIKEVPNINFEKAETNAVYRNQTYNGSDVFITYPGEMRQFHNLDDAELVILHYWTEEHMPIASFDPETCTVVTKNFSGFALADDTTGKYARYYIQNVKEGLCRPGQWYLDKRSGELTYLPLPEENIEDTPIVLPTLTEAVNIDGASMLTFENIEFNGFDRRNELWYKVMEIKYPDYESAASNQSASSIEHGIIELRNAQYIQFKGCSFLNGDSFGISILEGCRQIKIEDCEIAHMGAGGIRMNGAGRFINPDLSRPEAKPTGWTSVEHCRIHDVGITFHAASNIVIMNATHNALRYNELYDGYYTGIAMGWRWGYGDSVNGHNIVEYNHIHDLGKGVLSDFGGIYTLGNQTGSVLRGNVIHDIVRATYGGWGIYPDEGTTNMLIEDNIVYNTTGACFHEHYGKENIVRGNLFICSEGCDGCVTMTKKEDHNSMSFYNNTFITDGTKPYFFGGADVTSPGYISDINTFMCTTGKLPELFAANMCGDGKGGLSPVLVLSMAEWQAEGMDVHSEFRAEGAQEVIERARCT